MKNRLIFTPNPIPIVSSNLFNIIARAFYYALYFFPLNISSSSPRFHLCVVKNANFDVSSEIQNMNILYIQKVNLFYLKIHTETTQAGVMMRVYTVYTRKQFDSFAYRVVDKEKKKYTNLPFNCRI